MFSFIKDQLKKIYSQVTSQISTLFSKTSIDQETLQELETILICADAGVKTTKKIMAHLKKEWHAGTIQQGSDLKAALASYLTQILSSTKTMPKSNVYLLVGINGGGKTTFAGKLAHRLKNEGKRVLLVAADTFRAAATEQLVAWADRVGIPVVTGSQGQEPASVVFLGCERFKKENFDAIIIDTAGRLQTKANLMRELEKIKKIIQRHIADQTINTLLIIDAMLGQNSFEQARLFNESTDVQGIVLTKMDGTGKGGIVFAISDELNIPITYISFGENIDAVKSFNAQEYVDQLLSLE